MASTINMSFPILREVYFVKDASEDICSSSCGSSSIEDDPPVAPNQAQPLRQYRQAEYLLLKASKDEAMVAVTEAWPSSKIAIQAENRKVPSKLR